MPSNDQLTQVGGSRKQISGCGILPCIIAGYFYLVHNCQLMIGNSSCPMSTGALKQNNGFICATHNVGTSLVLEHKDGTILNLHTSNHMDFTNAMD